MSDEPYRQAAPPVDPQPDSLKVFELVDLRLFVSSLTPDECRAAINSLSDEQVKNAVYDRALCYPTDTWTQGIQKMYVAKVRAANRNVLAFSNIVDDIKKALQTWADPLRSYVPEDSNNLQKQLMSQVFPLIDNIGVTSTLSDYTLTKRNGLTALINIGNFIMDMPIFYTLPLGHVAWSYDGLGRAVANTVNSSVNDLQRQQMLGHGIWDDLLALAGRDFDARLFPLLRNAINSNSQVPFYNLFENQPQQGTDYQPQQGAGSKRKEWEESRASNKKQEGEDPQNDAKRRHITADKLINPRLLKASPGGTPAASMEQPVEAHKGPYVENNGLHKLYALQASTVSMGQVPAQPFESLPQSGHPSGSSQNNMGQAEGAQQGQPAKQVMQVMQVQQSQKHQQAPKPRGSTHPYKFDDIFDDISEEMFSAHAHKTPQMQTLVAPVVCKKIEGWFTIILQRTKAAAATGKEGEAFIKTQKNALSTLLWIMEACCIDRVGSPLSAEVCRKLSRDPVVKAVWECARMATPQGSKELVSDTCILDVAPFQRRLFHYIPTL